MSNTSSGQPFNSPSCRLVRELLDDAAVEPPLPDLPDGVESLIRHGPRDRYLFLLNHGDRDVTVETPADAVPLLGDAAGLAAKDVAVLRLP